MFPVSLAASLVRDERGQVIAAVGVARDETVRNELEAQLREAQKMDAVGRLAAGIAHDFNNLITVIVASCEEGSTPEIPHSVRERFDDIRVAAESAASLTRQLLTFSSRQIVQPRVMNVNEVVADTRRLIERLIKGGIDLQVRSEPQLGHVVADGLQLQQVLVNLAVNARDAMPHGGRLAIETRNVSMEHEDLVLNPQMPPGHYVLLDVADTGVGMDKDTLARIFEPFFTTKAVGKGTGLGLSTVYGIVKQSGGFIWAYSEPGLGTTFKIYLPRVATTEIPPPSSAGVVDAQAAGEIVLLVEDDRAVRALMQTYLTRLGYKVLVAASSDEAFAVCAGLESHPALLVTDITMPGVNGPALAEQLRATFPHLKVLFVSGYANAPFSGQGLLPSGAHFLAKPFVLKELSAKVRAVLDS